jgi:acetyl-CoA carboxylase biotin carboxyl carrier protein
MDTREIQKLIDFISKSDLSEVNLETSELKLQIKRNGGNPIQYIATPVQDSNSQSNEFAAPAKENPRTPVAVEAPLAVSNLIEIKAPMIGTFYRSAGPGKPNFIEVGDEINSGKVICILEAMKLFNEIEAEVSGKIIKILVDDATPVEYDQPLFLIDPS